MYLAEDARKEMGLYREDLVSLAYFLGSDYAEDVLGVGIVNAVEILHAFPMHPHRTAESSKTHTPDPEEPLQGLRRFKEWVQGYDFEGEFLGDHGNASSSSAATETSSSKDSTALVSVNIYDWEYFVANMCAVAVVFPCYRRHLPRNTRMVGLSGLCPSPSPTPASPGPIFTPRPVATRSPSPGHSPLPLH